MGMHLISIHLTGVHLRMVKGRRGRTGRHTLTSSLTGYHRVTVRGATGSATISEMAHLARKIDMIDTEMKSLSNNLTMQMKNLIDTVSTQIDALNANMELRTVNMDSRLDKFENRFLFRMLFAVSGLRICYILLSNNCEGIQCGSSWSGRYRCCFIPTIPDSCHPDSCRQDSCRPDSCDPCSCSRTELK